MTYAELERNLQTCGKEFYVEFFERFREIDWHDDLAVSTLTHNIAAQWKSQGKQFSEDSLKSRRIYKVRAIFNQNAQWVALLLISNSNVPEDTKKQADDYLLSAPADAKIRAIQFLLDALTKEE